MNQQEQIKQEIDICDVGHCVVNNECGYDQTFIRHPECRVPIKLRWTMTETGVSFERITSDEMIENVKDMVKSPRSKRDDLHFLTILPMNDSNCHPPGDRVFDLTKEFSKKTVLITRGSNTVVTMSTKLEYELLKAFKAWSERYCKGKVEIQDMKWVDVKVDKAPVKPILRDQTKFVLMHVFGHMPVWVDGNIAMVLKLVQLNLESAAAVKPSVSPPIQPQRQSSQIVTQDVRTMHYDSAWDLCEGKACEQSQPTDQGASAPTRLRESNQTMTESEDQLIIKFCKTFEDKWMKYMPKRIEMKIVDLPKSDDDVSMVLITLNSECDEMIQPYKVQLMWCPEIYRQNLVNRGVKPVKEMNVYEFVKFILPSETVCDDDDCITKGVLDKMFEEDISWIDARQVMEIELKNLALLNGHTSVRLIRGSVQSIVISGSRVDMRWAFKLSNELIEYMVDHNEFDCHLYAKTKFTNSIYYLPRLKDILHLKAMMNEAEEEFW